MPGKETPFLIDVATRHQAHVERLKTSDIKAYDEFLVQMAEDIRSRLNRVELTEATTTRLNRILGQVREDLQSTATKAFGIFEEQIIDLADYEQEFEVKSLNQVIEHEFDVASRPQLREAVFGAPMTGVQGPANGKMLEPFFRDWEQSTIDEVEGRIRSGYYQGQTTQEVVRNVVGTKERNYNDGQVARVRRNMESVVRTGLQHSAMRAREEVWRNNDDIVKRNRLVATLDSKTSTICRSIDGNEYEIGKGPRPPLHIRCRTTVIAVLDQRFKMLEQDGTRRDRDPETGDVGYTAANETYYGWLKRQPAKVQDSIVGPTRGQLLRNGGIDSERFAELQLGRDFKPLTLDEMRELEPVAFERAGITLD